MSIGVVECCVMGSSRLATPVRIPAEQATASRAPAASEACDIPAELAHHLALAVVAKALGVDYELNLPAFVTCDFEQSLPTQLALV